MTQLGLPRQVKNPDEAVAVEPALGSVQSQLAGGIFTPGDNQATPTSSPSGLPCYAPNKA